jgi:hypothetical protein
MVKRQCQLDHSEIAGQMAAAPADRVEDELPDLLGQGLELTRRQPLYVIGTAYLFQ